jgi:signal transduction histidine kinase
MMKHVVVLSKRYGDLPPVPCYPMQLKQVFMNLLVNAFQAIEEKIGGRPETGLIRLRTEIHGDRVVVSVSDTGTGITPENLARIFDPFFTTKKIGVGTGLGLSTCYSILRRNGGTLTVESQVGRGSTFRVEIPVDGGEMADAGA